MKIISHKKPRLFSIVFILIVLVVAGYFSYKSYKNHKKENTEKLSTPNLQFTDKHNYTGWKTYINYSYKFSFMYPSDWGDPSVNDKTINLGCDKENFEDDKRCPISVEVVSVINKPDENTEKLSINGLDAYKYESAGAYNIMYVAYIANDVKFLLHDDGEEYQSSGTFEKIRDSFKYFGPEVLSKSYVNIKSGIKFDYPTDWTLSDGSSNTESNVFLTLYPNGLDEDVNKINICMVGCGHGLEGYDKNSTADIAANGLTWNISYFTANGENGTDKETRAIIAPIPNSSEVGDAIEAYYNVSQDTLFKSVIEKIINSFQITK